MNLCEIYADCAPVSVSTVPDVFECAFLNSTRKIHLPAGPAKKICQQRAIGKQNHTFFCCETGKLRVRIRPDPLLNSESPDKPGHRHASQITDFVEYLRMIISGCTQAVEKGKVMVRRRHRIAGIRMCPVTDDRSTVS
jgi:hypothetical protein